MKKLLGVCVIALLLLFAGNAVAHEIYIGIDEDIEVNEQTEIRLYWGHFPADPDPVSSYFNSVPDGEFYIVEPDGGRISLPLERLDDHYRAVFTPSQAGDHWVVFSHDRGILDWTHSEPQGKQSIATYAKALLDVHGDDETVAFSRLAGHYLEILPLVDGGHLHAGELYMAQLLYHGIPLDGVSGTYYGPDDQSGEFITGPGGTFAFTPDVEGDWLVKISYFDDTKTGDGEEELLGARYTTTLLLTPHTHDDDDYVQTPTATSSGSSTYGYIALIVLMLLGAGFFFMKSNKQSA
ncbi:MAG: DUF4198 domain-containing protein [Clostridiales bacterium]|nr:DUF4198 domain-containing protein [Clostridiales bacterium]